MDTITQMLFGATVAQVGFRRRLGRRAIAAGALVALVPDLDIAAGWIGGPFVNWVHHRGLTHSILFGPVAGILFGWLIWPAEDPA
jgi:inner membrane protein